MWEVWKELKIVKKSGRFFFFGRHVGVGLVLIWLNVGLCLCFVGNFDN